MKSAIAVARALLPPSVVQLLDSLAERARPLLEGNPLRAIVYGAAGVVWIVTRLAFALGYQIEVVDLDSALLVATGASVMLTEIARQWVYSPATVASILEEKAADEAPNTREFEPVGEVGGA